MHTNHLEDQKVSEVRQEIAGAEQVLRRFGIDCGSRAELAIAAEAASVNTDELLAVLESRMRRAARGKQRNPRTS